MTEPIPEGFEQELPPVTQEKIDEAMAHIESK
jgi:hypothetical protein